MDTYAAVVELKQRVQVLEAQVDSLVTLAQELHMRSLQHEEYIAQLAAVQTRLGSELDEFFNESVDADYVPDGDNAQVEGAVLVNSQTGEAFAGPDADLPEWDNPASPVDAFQDDVAVEFDAAAQVIEECQPAPALPTDVFEVADHALIEVAAVAPTPAGDN
jgi:hypothetical protein